MAEAFTKLRAESAILDGELVLIDPRGAAHFYRLLAQMRTDHPDESQLMFMAFDLLHQDGVDLLGLPLSERKKDLHRLCAKSKAPFLKEVQTFPSGELLFEHCNKFGFEGVVSKRSSSRYMSGPSRLWTKSKCPDWKRDNTYRYILFEGPKKPPAQTERERALQRKRVELGRVRESLARVGLRAGLFAALKAQERALLQEIAELEGTEN
jgi:ATP dependent DNA ligase domain